MTRQHAWRRPPWVFLSHHLRTVSSAVAGRVRRPDGHERIGGSLVGALSQRLRYAKLDSEYSPDAKRSAPIHCSSVGTP